MASPSPQLLSQKSKSYHWFIPLFHTSTLIHQHVLLTVEVEVLVTQSCQLFATPWTAICQALLFMEFSRQESWSGSHSLLPGIFPKQASNPHLLHCRWTLSHWATRLQNILISYEYSRLHFILFPLLQQTDCTNGSYFNASLNLFIPLCIPALWQCPSY